MNLMKNRFLKCEKVMFVEVFKKQKPVRYCNAVKIKPPYENTNPIL
jgi:hypothetical protein